MGNLLKKLAQLGSEQMISSFFFFSHNTWLSLMSVFDYSTFLDKTLAILERVKLNFCLRLHSAPNLYHYIIWEVLFFLIAPDDPDR